MKRLKFLFHRQRICTKCGNVQIEPNDNKYSKDIYLSECSDCYDKKYRIQSKRKLVIERKHLMY